MSPTTAVVMGHDSSVTAAQRQSMYGATLAQQLHCSETEP
ncbi:hypothetical protein I552_3947 [Mycobacterium xenopi 3993]|nr:hypothetical protein I552_3947 [Mycobacterium xenopi 3993]